MRIVIILFLIITPYVFVNAQNLVPNGSFEDYKSCTTNREAAVFDAAPWYIAGGTPDAYQFRCNDPNLRESIINTPYEGDVFIAIGGGVWQGGAFFSEGLAVELVEPLEAGKSYLLEVHTRSYRFNGTDQRPRNQCDIEPVQSLNIHLSQDSFQINQQFENNFLYNSTTNGHIVYSNNSLQTIPPYQNQNSNFFTDEVIVSWQNIFSCVKAKGGEKFLGISLQTGNYELDPNCQSVLNIFPIHYINLDYIRLIKIPNQIEATIPICINEPNEIRLEDFIPAEINVVKYEWSDGQSTSVRNLQKEGIQIVKVITECDTALLVLTLDGTDCKTYINMPTAFSPNNYDGINDEIKPFIKNYWEIMNYEYQVFNRWGQLLFKTNDYEKAWNGLVKGKTANQGVYVWSVKYEQNEDGEIKTYVQSGNFTLMK